MAARKPATPKPDPKDPSGVETKREQRARLIDKANEQDADKAKADQAAFEAAGGKGVLKRDDAGAAEQQRSAADNAIAIELGNEDLDKAPVVAPIIDEGNPGSFKIVAGDGSGEEIKSALFVTIDARIYGEGFPAPGEVIIDIRREDGQDHQRFSTFTHDGTIDMPLVGITPVPGTWLIHAESPVTQVGDGRDDHLPVIRQGDEVKLEVK